MLGQVKQDTQGCFADIIALVSGGSSIFPRAGAPTPKIAIIFHIFAENCMKMKEFGPPGGGARPWRPPLDPPMLVHGAISLNTA